MGNNIYKIVYEKYQVKNFKVIEEINRSLQDAAMENMATYKLIVVLVVGFEYFNNLLWYDWTSVLLQLCM